MKKITILIVDDCNGMRIVLVGAVEDYCKERRIHCDILAASDGKEAVDILNKKYVDVLFTDVKMPRMGGEKLVQLLDLIAPETIPVMMTGTDGYKPPENFAVEACLEKPIMEEHLYEVMDKIVDEISGEEMKG